MGIKQLTTDPIEKFIKDPIDSTVKVVKDTFTKEPKIEEIDDDGADALQDFLQNSAEFE